MTLTPTLRVQSPAYTGLLPFAHQWFQHMGIHFPRCEGAIDKQALQCSRIIP